VIRAARGLLVLALVLAGCGGGGRTHGTATLWVTRDRGAQVVFRGEVPAGLTAMQALDRKLDVSTRYGGRFVQSISGIDGSLSRQRDWFFFVNGVEADRSAAEVRLRPGDVEWWDYRSWRDALSVPVVVGAFPEPFRHGYGWAKRGARVVALRSADEPVARRLARVVGRPSASPPNTIRIDPRVPERSARAERVGGVVRLTLGVEAARRLARDPGAVRFRYEVRG
jgi:Domain of unknown function (DUF4430)